MKVQVKEMIKFEDSNAGFPSCGMGMDMDIAYVPVEDTKMCAEMEALAPKLSQEEIEHYAKLAEHYDGQLDYEARA